MANTSEVVIAGRACLDLYPMQSGVKLQDVTTFSKSVGEVRRTSPSQPPGTVTTYSSSPAREMTRSGRTSSKNSVASVSRRRSSVPLRVCRPS